MCEESINSDNDDQKRSIEPRCAELISVDGKNIASRNDRFLEELRQETENKLRVSHQKKRRNMKYVIETFEVVSIIRFIGPPVFDDIINAIDDLAAYQPKLRLWDLSGGMNLSNDELRRIAEYGKQKFTTPASVSIVSPPDLSYSILRVFGVYREREVSEVGVFRTEKEALSWLEKQNAVQ